MPLRRLSPVDVRRRIAAGRAARLRRAQLPVVVSVIAAYVRAGRSLRQAVADAAGDVPEPSAAALREAAARVALGATPDEALAAFELVAGAGFLGSVLDGLLLGHWYLTDRGLSRISIDRATRIVLVAVVVEAIAVIAGGFSGVASSEAFNPLLTAGALAPWIALGMVGTTALIAVMVKATLRGTRASAVQSATGFFYLAVVTAFTAEVAVKVRFLPG